MKSHISATINTSLLQEVRRISRQERRSLSNVIEVALAAYLKGHTMLADIPTSEGVVQGSFKRAEVYED